jgi:hypothetical protein
VGELSGPGDGYFQPLFDKRTGELDPSVGGRRGHCYSGPVSTGVRLQEMAQHIRSEIPEGRTTPWWQ